ncbi:MAG TPA: RNA-binding cell elongation regulator Jag/EloR [Acidimicrobiales bacterium]|jgi:spoIIIJ-associated protein|nr:RNA-binding cell elongation regulator Jag/EloR [Acidimicrobiales bacterium]
MEWVETTGRTLEEAKDRALDQLGVDEKEAEFEIVEHPRPGLFGRLRGQARVRARVRPTRPRPKVDRRERRRRKGDGHAGDGTDAHTEPAEGATPARVSRSAAGSGEAQSGATPSSGSPTSSTTSTRRRPRRGSSAKGETVDNDSTTAADRAETTGERTPVDPAQLGADAVAFVEGVVGAFGVDADVELEVRDDAVELDVQGESVGLLIGPRGQTMAALQDLTRMAVQRRVGPDAPRLSVDVGSYRQRRHEALRRFAERVAGEVLESGETRMLEPMSAVDRKVVHDAVNEIDGVVTSSDGEEPQRRVVISPAG